MNTPRGVWRMDPEVEPGSVGVDQSALDKMEMVFAEAVEAGELCYGAQMCLHRAGKRVKQLGATFVVGPGSGVRYRHIDADSTDHATVDDVLSALG